MMCLEKIKYKTMKDRIYRLKEILENVDSSDFHYDSYHSGKLEEIIVQSQIEVTSRSKRNMTIS